MNKQQQQLYALGGIGVILVGVIGYYFRDSFMPVPDVAEQLPTVNRLEIPAAQNYDRIFKREDFGNLMKSTVEPVNVDSDNPPAEIFIMK